MNTMVWSCTKPNRKNEPGHYAATRANRSNQEFNGTPQFGVLKTGRKEALYHDDPAVASQVEAEQEKVQQEKTERIIERQLRVESWKSCKNSSDS